MFTGATEEAEIKSDSQQALNQFLSQNPEHGPVQITILQKTLETLKRNLP